jgi:hypothetical protein
LYRHVTVPPANVPFVAASPLATRQTLRLLND